MIFCRFFMSKLWARIHCDIWNQTANFWNIQQILTILSPRYSWIKLCKSWESCLFGCKFDPHSSTRCDEFNDLAFCFLAFRLFRFYPIKSIRCLWAITPEWLLRMTFTQLWQKREKLQTKFRMLCDREINRPNFSHTGENVVKFKKKHFELMTHEKQNPTIC